MEGKQDPTDEPQFSKKLKQKIQPTFLHYIKPHNVLAFFHAYNEKVLVQNDIDRVKAVTDSKGNQEGATELLDRLVIYDGWFDCLMQVLKDRCVQLDHVAKVMEGAKRLVEDETEKNKICEAEVRRLTDILNQKEQLLVEKTTLITKLEKENKEMKERLDDMESKFDQQLLSMSSTSAENDTLRKKLEDKDITMARLIAGKDQFIHAVLELNTTPNISALLMENLISKGQNLGLEFLTYGGIDINMQITEGKTGVILAAKDGHTDCLKHLINKGADVNKKDSAGKTALIYATEGGHIECLTALLDAGADKEATDEKTGFTVLMEAVVNRECVQKLLTVGCDIHRTDNSGRTALFLAVVNKNPESVQVLLSAGSDPNRQSFSKITPLMIAAFNGDSKCMKTLLDGRASPNVSSDLGQTPLMLAALQGHSECVCLLLKSCADHRADDYQSNTALIYAAMEGHIECVRSLVSAGADIEHRNINKKRAIDLAKNAECRNFLKQAS